MSVKKNKVTGVNAGTTVLSFTQDEKVYKVTVIVEDLNMSGTGLKAQQTGHFVWCQCFGKVEYAVRHADGIRHHALCEKRCEKECACVFQ